MAFQNIVQLNKDLGFYASNHNFCPALTKLALDLHVYFSLFVCIWGLLFLSKRQSLFCLIHLWGSSGAFRGQKTTFHGKRPLMEDNLRWKTSFDGRQPFMEEDL